MTDNTQKIYQSQRGKMLILSLIGFACGLLCLTASLDIIAKWKLGNPPNDPLIFFVFLGVPLFLGMGIAVFFGVLKGKPRLIVDAHGIRYESAITTIWAHWASLSPFQLLTQTIGARRKKFYFAVAHITGKDTSPRLQKRKKLTIPNAFITDINTLISELNAYRKESLAASGIADVAQAPASPAPLGVPGITRPWLTLTMLAVLVALFLCELNFAVTPSHEFTPSIQTLIALGGLNRNVIESTGEWYRLFTAPLLHGSFLHIFMNGLALLMCGVILERFVGRKWMFAFFITGAAGGSLMSLMINSPLVTSVGASGAIMGLFAAMFVCSFHLTQGPERTQVQTAALRTLIPSLLPLATSTGMHIDYGALSGAAMGYILVKRWPSTMAIPPLPELAKTICIIGLILFGVSFLGVANRYHNYTDLPATASADELAKAKNDPEKLSALARTYPHDPAVDMYMAENMMKARNFDGAEIELETAIADAQKMKFIFGDKPDLALHIGLAGVLALEGRTEDARKTAAPACASTDKDLASAKAMLKESKLCE